MNKIEIIMDYEKKYKEALEKARQLCVYPTSKPFISDLQDLFPELKKPEDEEIRKGLIENFKWFCGDYPETAKWGKDDNLLVKDIIAWLEKQGKVPVTINIDKMVEDYANNEDCDNEGFGKPVNCMIRAYRQGLTDAIATVMLEKQGEQKPAWSREDDNKVKEIIEYLDAFFYNYSNDYKTWFNSLKDRVQPQPQQELSKEDEKAINDILWIIEAYRKDGFNETHIQMANNSEKWLKSIKQKIVTK